MQTRIWQPETEFAVHLRFAKPGSISITYLGLPYGDFSRSLYTRVKLERPSPAAELVLTLEDFDVDWFQWTGSVFVSERMRQAMAVDLPEARFFPVDDSKSAPMPRSKNYWLMDPEVSEPVLDADGSQFEMRRFVPHVPPVPVLTGRCTLRADAAPEHELFYDSFVTTVLFCTDALAMRVIEAGCTGVRFMEPNSRADQNLFRTLRGLERSTGRFHDALDTTELVEAIG